MRVSGAIHACNFTWLIFSLLAAPSNLTVLQIVMLREALQKEKAERAKEQAAWQVEREGWQVERQDFEDEIERLRALLANQSASQSSPGSATNQEQMQAEARHDELTEKVCQSHALTHSLAQQTTTPQLQLPNDSKANVSVEAVTCSYTQPSANLQHHSHSTMPGTAPQTAPQSYAAGLPTALECATTIANRLLTCVWIQLGDLRKANQELADAKAVRTASQWSGHAAHVL